MYSMDFKSLRIEMDPSTSWEELAPNVIQVPLLRLLRPFTYFVGW